MRWQPLNIADNSMKMITMSAALAAYAMYSSSGDQAIDLTDRCRHRRSIFPAAEYISILPVCIQAKNFPEGDHSQQFTMM